MTPSPASSVVSLCQKLVRVPSLSGGEGALAGVVGEEMTRRGFAVEVDALGNVIGRRGGGRSAGPTLLLDAHMDTVPVVHPEAWRHDPFGGELSEDRLWGRGAADTKGSLAAMICAVAGLEGCAGTVLVSASVCEEDLTSAALAHVLTEHRPTGVLVGEPTLLKLGVAQKGRAGLVLASQGRTAHTSQPELGDNAVYRMMEAIGRLRAAELQSDPELGPAVRELVEIVSSPRPSAGMIPDCCTARFALRVLPDEGEEAILHQATDACGGLASVEVRWAVCEQTTYTRQALAMREFVPGWRNHDRDLERRLLQALGTQPFAAPYTTNASAAATLGIPVFLLGPGSIEQAHIVDEWIAVSQLEAAVGSYQTAIRTWLDVLSARGSQPPPGSRAPRR